jgi:GT2 family glycosyltransferase
VDHDPDDPGFYELRPRLRTEPSVSIVIPTNGDTKRVFGTAMPLLERCVGSIVQRSTYANYQIVVVADSITSPAALARARELAGDRLVVVPFDQPFNFAKKINVGVLHSGGEHIVMLNDDTDVITPSWIESLLMYSTFDGVGAVGAQLRYEDERIQHAGLTTCKADSGPVHLYHGFPGSSLGYFSTIRNPANVLAVTGACLMTPRERFDAVGGMSEQFPSSYNDVDYCLKLRELGDRVVYAPEAKLHHFESMSRDASVDPVEEARFRRRWGSYLGNDPYYNPSLVAATAAMRIRGDYGLGLDQPLEDAG